MEFEEIRDYCLNKEGSSEETPFGPDTLVYKVRHKMFALLSFDHNTSSINLKNHPDINLELRERYPFITPGYHMNKKHWNTITVQPNVDSALIKGLIDASYLAVLKASKP